MQKMILSFRPFKFLKKFLPKTLFARSLLIILLPIVLVQSVTTYVFIDRHWSWVTKHIAQTIASQIVTVVDMIDREDPMLDITASRFALGIRPLKTSPIVVSKKTYSWDESYFDRILSRGLTKPHHIRMTGNNLIIDVQLKSKAVRLVTARKRIFAKTTPIFLMWTLGAPLVFFIIAAIFMRNQIRPIRRLANAAYLFGKRQLIKPFKPQGAYEVRRAAIAFNQMRERIDRQISQRTEMLAGVSHDLRTPLTRMELQLAMMKDGPEVKGLKRDIKEMSKTIDEYIAFARGDEKEASCHINLSALLKEVIQKLNSSKIQYKVDLPNILKLSGREHSLERCFTNILVNAQKYAPHIWVSGHQEAEEITIIIEDNGPGIPLDKRQDVFKPFYRLESSRNRETGGSGLGLAIAYDIVISHGGTITLKDSSKGGLKVEIILPE